MNNATLMAIKIDNRSEDAPKFQDLITKHGCIIKTRLGLHEVGNCANEGLIMLQLDGNSGDIAALETDINALPTVKAQSMNLDF